MLYKIFKKKYLSKNNIGSKINLESKTNIVSKNNLLSKNNIGCNLKVTDSYIYTINIIYNFNTLESQKIGLMNIKIPLPHNTGALFNFYKYIFVRFYMKNTVIPLDIIFLDENYKILCIFENTTPLSVKPLYCPCKIFYVIETNARYVSINNIKVGDFLYPITN